jgi:hypothetical protein
MMRASSNATTTGRTHQLVMLQDVVLLRSRAQAEGTSSGELNRSQITVDQKIMHGHDPSTADPRWHRKRRALSCGAPSPLGSHDPVVQNQNNLVSSIRIVWRKRPFEELLLSLPPELRQSHASSVHPLLLTLSARASLL